MKNFRYFVVGNRYKKGGAVHKIPFVIAGFKNPSDAYAFEALTKKAMPLHNIRVIGR